MPVYTESVSISEQLSNEADFNSISPLVPQIERFALPHHVFIQRGVNEISDDDVVG